MSLLHSHIDPAPSGSGFGAHRSHANWSLSLQLPPFDAVQPVQSSMAPDVPRKTDHISPLINNPADSQASSQPGSQNGNLPSASSMQTMFNNQQSGHGSWPAPSGSPSYIISNVGQHQQSLPQSPMGQRALPLYQPPHGTYNQPRNSLSPAHGGEGLPVPQYHQGHVGFPGSGNSNHHPLNDIAQHSITQTAATGGTPVHMNALPHGSQGNPSQTHYPFSHQSHHGPAYPTNSRINSMNGAFNMGPSAPMHAPYPRHMMPNPHGTPNMHTLLPTMPSHYGSQPMMYPHGPPQTERPFKCDQCTQSFSRNHDLKRHKRIHLAVKPFPCNYCSKSFSRKDALKRHKLVKGCDTKAKEVGAPDDNASDRRKSSDSEGYRPPSRD